MRNWNWWPPSPENPTTRKEQPCATGTGDLGRPRAPTAAEWCPTCTSHPDDGAITIGGVIPSGMLRAARIERERDDGSAARVLSGPENAGRPAGS